MKKTGNKRTGIQSYSHMQGVYAIEYALVVSIFFSILYAIIWFGLAFLISLSMRFAAEDGARSSLYKAIPNAPYGQKNLDIAKETVLKKLSWLPMKNTSLAENITVKFCKQSTDNCTSAVNTCSSYPKSTNAEAHEIRVELTYDYSENFTIPSIFPINLHAKSSMLLDCWI